MEWVLTMFLAANRPPEIVAKGYETAEQCEMAAGLFEAADNAVRKAKNRFAVVCKENPKSGEKHGDSRHSSAITE